MEVLKSGEVRFIELIEFHMIHLDDPTIREKIDPGSFSDLPICIKYF